MNDLIKPNFEEKGKIFTEVVSKVVVEVTLQTTTHRIRGKIHVRPGERLKDEIDRGELSLAVTEAAIFDLDGKSQLLNTKFMAIQKSHIVWVLPDSEIES